MFSHVVVGANDIEAAKKFYDAIFGAFEGPSGMIDSKGRLIYQHNGGIFTVVKPLNGEPACGANGGTIGFLMTQEQVDAWWQAGQEAGGTACEDPPGQRAGSSYYLAYLKDSAGNKLCAACQIG